VRLTVNGQLSLEEARAHYAQFGAASPNPDLLPTVKLNRILADLARNGKISHDSGVAVEGSEALQTPLLQIQPPNPGIAVAGNPPLIIAVWPGALVQVTLPAPETAVPESLAANCKVPPVLVPEGGGR